jgi:hypothetical protein
MTIRHGRIRRLAVYGMLLAAVAGPTVAAIGATPAADRPLAACPQDEHLDPTTFYCMPGPLPAAVDVAPGLSPQWQEQDIFGTPGVTPDPSHGTMVP